MDITEYAMMKKVFKKLSPDSDPVLQEKTITENGEYTPDDGYDGLSKVTVNVEGSGSSDLDLVCVTFKTHDGNELHRRAVVKGNTCMCPVTGAIKEIDTPTRESTAQYHFTFAGWATTPNGGLDENALKDVTEDRTVYANYIATLRSYTISYYDDDGTPLHSEILAYGSTPSYRPEKENMDLAGWEPEIQRVTGDAEYYAKWEEGVLGEGTHGTNFTWKLYKTGTFVLTGSGEMDDSNVYGAYSYGWNSLRSSIKSIVFEGAITKIAKYAFQDCKVADITISSTVTVIGRNAFNGNKSLREITIPASVTSIDGNAFASTSLTKAYFDITTGWTYRSGMSLTASEMANAYTAANYLTGDWAGYGFYRK